MGPAPPPPPSPIFPRLPQLSRPFLLFLASFLSFSTLSQSQSQSQQQASSIYDHLRLNGLPTGLLPKGITEFSLDPSTGHFQINLSQPCSSKFESLVHYEFNVSGYMSVGKLSGLSGMSQQELFIWLPVHTVRVDIPTSGLIYFDVGVANKQFSLSSFENPLECTTTTTAAVADPGLQPFIHSPPALSSL